jgi:hypothetical protein
MDVAEQFDMVVRSRDNEAVSNLKIKRGMVGVGGKEWDLFQRRVCGVINDQLEVLFCRYEQCTQGVVSRVLLV